MLSKQITLLFKLINSTMLTYLVKFEVSFYRQIIETILLLIVGIN